MKIFELFIDEDAEFNGVNALSIVENPAIGEDFVALNSQDKPVLLAEMDADKLKEIKEEIDEVFPDYDQEKNAHMTYHDENCRYDW